MKKTLFLILALCLLVLPACRRTAPASPNRPGSGVSEDAPTTRTEVLTGVYRPVALALPEGERSMSVSRFAVTVPWIDPALGTVTVYTENQAGQGFAVTTGVESGVLRDVTVPLPEGMTYSAGAFAGDLFWYIAADVDVNREAMWEDDRTAMLCCLDCASGEMREIGDVRPLFPETSRFGCHVSVLTVDADGDLWLGSAEMIAVVSPEGEKICEIPGTYNQPMQITPSPDGTVWLAETNRILIMEKTTPDKPRRLDVNMPADRIVFAGEHDFCYASSAGIWGADLDEDGNVTAELLMNFNNSGVDPMHSALLGAFGEDAFLLAEQADGGAAPVLYCVSEDVSLSSLSVLEIAFTFNPEGGNAFGFTSAIVEYNRSHPDRRVLMKDYAIYNNSENPDGGENRLVMDMLTGVYRPDIVVTATRSTRPGGPKGITADAIAEKRLYTDLAPYLAADDTVNRETVFGAIQRFFATEDGGMWGIAPAFKIETLEVSPLLIGEALDGWTLGEMLDFIESLPPDTFLMTGLTQETAAAYLLGPTGYGAFIDRASATCSFDSPEFTRWLRIVGSLPKEYAALSAMDPPMNYMSGNNLEAHWTGGVAFAYLRLLNGFRDLMELEVPFGTEDWIVPGFPVGEGNGTAIECDAAVVMTSFCREPDFAWELIRTFVSETFAAHFAFPALKEHFRTQAAQEIDWGSYNTTTFSGASRIRGGGYVEDGIYPTRDSLKDPGWITIPTWEKYEHFAVFLDERAGYPMTETLPPEIAAIVAEEISAYLGGVGTPESCAWKIQSRVSLWLAEHS